MLAHYFNGFCTTRGRGEVWHDTQEVRMVRRNEDHQGQLFEVHTDVLPPGVQSVPVVEDANAPKRKRSTKAVVDSPRIEVRELRVWICKEHGIQKDHRCCDIAPEWELIYEANTTDLDAWLNEIRSTFGEFTDDD